MDSYFLDQLIEKHERMSFDATKAVRLEVDLGGERVHVLVAAYLAKVRVVKVTRDGELLFILGEIDAPPSWGMRGDGVIIVARREQADVYAARIWHDLYPGTVGELLPQPSGGG